MTSTLSCRVKCFLEGLPYGVSIEPVACLTRESLEAALKETLLEDQSALKSKSLEMFVYNCEVSAYFMLPDISAILLKIIE